MMSCNLILCINLKFFISYQYRFKASVIKSHIENKIKEGKYKEEIISGINQEIERNNQDVYDKIISNRIVIKNV